MAEGLGGLRPWVIKGTRRGLRPKGPLKLKGFKGLRGLGLRGFRGRQIDGDYT